MTAWAILGAICGLFAFGAVMYRSGRKAAENKALRAKERDNAQVDKALRAAGRLSRVDLLKRMCGREK